MIPTAIFAGLFAGILIRRPLALLSTVVALGIAWALFVTFTPSADFLGAFAFGVVNAAVGAVFGAGLRALASGARSTRRPV